jgi:riboflavin synthase, alpha subunit
MKISPISEMKTELVMANVLSQEIKQKSSRLSKMRESLNEYHERQSNSLEVTPTDKTQNKPLIQASSNEINEYDVREKIIIDWAKVHYKDIQSIHQFPYNQHKLKSKITPGVVYLCLKKHSFIKQNETTEYRVMDSYFRFNGNLQWMCEELGLTVWVVAKTVEKLGYSPRWHQYRESRYVTRASSGTNAEEKFKQLVPDAIDMNEDYRENNPCFDFIVNGKTIDVKELTKITRKETLQSFYDFKLHKLDEDRADYYCLFLCLDKDKRIRGPFDIILIPKEALPNNKSQMKISTSKTSNSHRFFYQFQVDPASLAHMLGCEV